MKKTRRLTTTHVLVIFCTSVFGGIFCGMYSRSANAELFGMVSGRSARLPSQSALSVEAGFNWYTSQLQWSVARINAKPSDSVLIYLDVAELSASKLPITPTSQANFAGTGFGGGVVFALPKLLNRYDLAFKAAFHEGAIGQANSISSEDSNQLDRVAGSSANTLQQAQWSSAVLISGIDPWLENGLFWYATAGYFSTNAGVKMVANLPANSSTGVSNSASETKRFISYKDSSGFVLGVGVVKPIRKGRIFAGLKFLGEDPLFGVGFRFNVR